MKEHEYEKERKKGDPPYQRPNEGEASPSPETGTRAQEKKTVPFPSFQTNPQKGKLTINPPEGTCLGKRGKGTPLARKKGTGIDTTHHPP